MEYEKECPICGNIFKTPTKIRLYCDDCLAHEKRNRNDVYHAQARARQYQGEKIKEYTCYTCGKQFKSLDRLVAHVSPGSSHDGKCHAFCSPKCKQAYKHEHATCRWCGKSIKDNPDYDMMDWHTWYCNDKCREEERWAIARKTGMVHKCRECGKEFISKEDKFCSKQCYRLAVDKGWRNNPIPQETVVQRNVECPVCHKKWVKTYRGNIKDENLSKPVVCSKECGEKFSMLLAERRAQKKRAAETEEKRKAMKRERDRDRAELRKPDLCATCKVPYKDCERMQSDFRITPKGAHYNQYGKLTECPKYRA